MRVTIALLSLGLLAASPLIAGEVSLTKTHICCQKCVDSMEAALADVEGVSDVSVDQETKTVTFQATDTKTARAGVRALAKAGFGGEATHDGKAVKTPPSKIEADAKADEVKVAGLHLCCGKCVKAVDGAVTAVDGVESAACDEKKGTCTVTGKDVNIVKVLEALQAAGFHGNVAGPKGEGEKGKKKKKKTEDS